MSWVISWREIGIYIIENIIKNRLLGHSDMIKRTLVQAAVTALWAGDKVKTFAPLATVLQ